MSLSQIEGDMGLIRRTDLCCEKSVHWETRELSWAKGLIAIRTGLGQDFPMLLALSFAPHIQYLCPPAVRQTANPSRMRTMSMYTINHHCLVRIKSALQPVPNKEIQDSFWKQWDSMQQSIHFTPCPPVRWTVPAHCLPICTAAILHSAAVLISVSSLSAHTFPRVQHPTDPGSPKTQHGLPSQRPGLRPENSKHPWHSPTPTLRRATCSRLANRSSHRPHSPNAIICAATKHSLASTMRAT